jgi:uncharacterized protein (TIGR03437 family)
VTIAAGATSATFSYSGVAPGVEEVTAVPGDSSYETAVARVQVAGAEQLRLVQVSADPLVAQLTDANGLVYPQARIQATASAGSVSPASVLTDAHGRAAFNWQPGAGADNTLTLSLSGFPAVTLTLHAGSAVPSISSVVNAASFESGVAAGGLQTIFGAHLAGAQVLVNGTTAPVLYSNDSQINFYVPLGTALGAATIAVAGPSGAQATASVTVAAVQPGIFAGGVLPASPVKAGDSIQIYCTGLGPTANVPIVFIGATPLQPVSSGLAPGTPGVYQVKVRVPDGLAPGPQSVLLSVSLAHSNQVQIVVE